MRAAIIIALALLAGCKSEKDIRAMCFHRGEAAAAQARIQGGAFDDRVTISKATHLACLAEHGLQYR